MIDENKISILLKEFKETFIIMLNQYLDAIYIAEGEDTISTYKYEAIRTKIINEESLDILEFNFLMLILSYSMEKIRKLRASYKEALTEISDLQDNMMTCLAKKELYSEDMPNEEQELSNI